MGDLNVLDAKAKGLVLNLRLAKDLGLQVLAVESDSTELVKLVKLR